MFKLLVNKKDMTAFVTRITWGSDMDQAARHLEFEIAYTTPEKDQAFSQLQPIALGDTVSFYSASDDLLFQGRVFVRRRNTDSFVMSFVAYDALFYLARSKVNLVFKAMPVADAIKSVCSQVGVGAVTIPDIPVNVSFVADEKTGSEVIDMLLERVYAQCHTSYVLITNGSTISLMEKGTPIQDYVAKTKYNVLSSSHSESGEDVVNRVIVLNEVGTVVTTYENQELVTKLGALTDVYKTQPVKPGETVNNTERAKAKLTAISTESTLRAIGDVRVQTGRSIVVQEEQLTGRFLVISDTHTFERNKHTMELGLMYLGKEEGHERR